MRIGNSKASMPMKCMDQIVRPSVVPPTSIHTRAARPLLVRMRWACASEVSEPTIAIATLSRTREKSQLIGICSAAATLSSGASVCRRWQTSVPLPAAKS